MKRLALAGVTHIHTPGFVSMIKNDAQLSVARVYDKNEVRARPVANDLGATLSTLEDIISDSTLDGIVICSETVLHRDLVRQLVAAGKPLFIEKPVGFSPDDSRKIADLIEHSGVIFQTGYFMRSDSVHIYLKSAIARGAFGTVTSISMSTCHAGAIHGIFDSDYRWMAETKTCGYGGFGDLGFHALDIMMWLMGPVESVIATTGVTLGKYPKIDEYGQGLLRFKDGAIGHLRAGWVSPQNPNTVEISGTEGHARVTNGKLYLNSPHIKGAEGEAPWTDLPAALPHAFRNFLDHVQGKTKNALIPIREASQVDIVMGAFYKSVQTGTWETPA
ncbi:MAG: Gfo/Idh/MocA family oxidoreductase [Verrucomicrobia bacterium]|nr:Gfo/Idh/MocA family oxidoreductase [Verrucomicrobiota bacterium]